MAAEKDVKKAIENPIVFDPNSNKLTYSRFGAQYLSEPIATNDDDSSVLCIAVDENFYSYIVSISSDQITQYQKLIDFTYGDSTKNMAPVSMSGIPREIPEYIKETIITEVNWFYDDEIANTDNLSDIVGTFYLDTAGVPDPNYLETVGYFALLVAAIIALGIITYFQDQDLKFHMNTLNKFPDSKLLTIDQELNQPSTVSFLSQKLFITENYLVSKVKGIDIISLCEITHVYGYNSSSILRKKQGIMAVTQYGTKHKIASITSQYQDDFLIKEIVDKLKSVLPDIRYGFAAGFYYEKNADPSAEQSAESAGNVPLGILGAVLGAALASILWILIGMIGFIAGFAGYVIVLLAIRGYGLLAGSIDRKGKIIAICIAFLMLFVANYSTYALMICKDNNTWSFEAIRDAYQMLPELLMTGHNLPAFVLDIFLGLAFSIAASFQLIKSAFSRENTDEDYHKNFPMR
jgi:hypothetical protein